MAKKILVVDDDAMNLRMAEFILTKQGYEVKKADSGRECLTILQDEPMDLLLLDVEMPEMNGMQTLRKLRQDNIQPQLPVMFLSASMDEETVAYAEKLGCVDFIKKPFLPPDLLERVAKTLEG